MLRQLLWGRILSLGVTVVRGVEADDPRPRRQGLTINGVRKNPQRRTT
jgi:hypothetical protein